jgi:beta-N-acetylhexosaminidase
VRIRGRTVACATRLAIAGVVLTPVACGSSSARTAIDPPAATPARTPAAAPASAPAPTRSAAAACRPASLERQAAATLIVGLPDTHSPSDPLAVSVPALGVGGILLTSANVQSADQIRALVTALRTRRGAPLLVAADEEGGRVSTFSGVLGYQPSARSASALGPAALSQRATTLGRQLRSIGVTVDFAPVLDVTGAPDDAPIGDRSFSADPATASADALAVARGLAGGGVTPVLKHFPGLGGADADTHLTAPAVKAPIWVLLYRDMRPFIEAIDSGAPVVMVGHALYPALGDPDLPASLSPAIYRQLQALKFRGVTITDSLGMGAVNLRFDFPVAAVKALAAGSDGLLTTDANQALRMRDAIVAAVHTRQLSTSRLADAAAHVTALAGGDPYPLTCRHVSLPTLR